MTLVIIGLDGASFNVLDPLCAQGFMPNLARLAPTGLRAELLSTLPVATLPAWSSFLTACEPARHGVTDLFVRHGYSLRAATGGCRTEPTFMRRLTAMGRTVACLGMPGTYPPEQAGGWCIAGFDAPDARGAGRRAVWPPPLYRQLKRWGGWRYATFNEHGPEAQRLQRATAALVADIGCKERLVLNLLRQQPWDVFCLHLQASDTAAHHLWHTWDRTSPRYSPGHDSLLPHVYQRLDTLLGRLEAAAPPGSRFLLVSDHGMGGAATVAVHLNRWLHRRGLLHFATSPVHSLQRFAGYGLRGVLRHLPTTAASYALRATPAALLARAMQTARGAPIAYHASQAFSDEFDYAPSIWLNRQDAFTHGCVTSTQAAALSDQLAAELLTLCCPTTGARLVSRVHTRASLPPGPHSTRLPDLLVEPAWPGGFRPSFLPSPGPGEPVRQLPQAAYGAAKGAGMPGVHRREGVLLAWGPGIAAQRIWPLHIAEAGALVYTLLGIDPPRDIDARVPAFVTRLLQADTPHAPEDVTDCDAPYAAAQSAALLQRLASLGYI